MNEANAIKLMQCLGVDNAIVNGEWLRAVARWRFTGTRRAWTAIPSFGIHIEPSGKSGYLCYSCQIQARDLADLVLDISYALKVYAAAAPAP